jgi:hypothetical protein
MATRQLDGTQGDGLSASSIKSYATNMPICLIPRHIARNRAKTWTRRNKRAAAP